VRPGAAGHSCSAWAAQEGGAALLVRLPALLEAALAQLVAQLK
jgi:hypothetical protein